jgi:hypothetical protein
MKCILKGTAIYAVSNLCLFEVTGFLDEMHNRFEIRQGIVTCCQRNYLSGKMRHFFDVFFHKNCKAMKQALNLSQALKSVFVTAITLITLGSAAFAGIDSYEVYLDNKLLIRQSMAEPLDLKTLAISEANRSQKLVIKYVQCNAPNQTGKNRSISIRNESGKIVKEWKFKDAAGKGSVMEIPVNEVLALQKNSQGNLALFYSADGMEKTQKLAALGNAKKSDS